MLRCANLFSLSGDRARVEVLCGRYRNIYITLLLPCGRSRLLKRHGRVFAFRYCSPGSISTSGSWDFSAPCDMSLHFLYWPNTCLWFLLSKLFNSREGFLTDQICNYKHLLLQFMMALHSQTVRAKEKPELSHDGPSQRQPSVTDQPMIVRVVIESSVCPNVVQEEIIALTRNALFVWMCFSPSQQLWSFWYGQLT